MSDDVRSLFNLAYDRTRGRHIGISIEEFRDELYEELATRGLLRFPVADPQLREPYDGTGCDGCTCCTQAGCHRGPDSGCPVGSEGTYWDGEFVCPCTGG